ncbi:MAG TPA: GrpB family protein [Candidatus Binatia bacterium]|nr:GrpB family protein [Candidatus Binatia bacterium]
MRNIIVVPYDRLWVEEFRREAALISGILGAELLSIHHIGSTAIPGISAKPVIDVMPVVSDIQRVDAFSAAMERIGYCAKGEYGIAGRRFFVKGDDASRTHHVHTYEPDNPEVRRHLEFRNYLRAHPEDAQEYSRLKIQLAERFRDDIDGYMAGKDASIKSILLRAQSCARKQSASVPDFVTSRRRAGSGRSGERAWEGQGDSRGLRSRGRRE